MVRRECADCGEFRNCLRAYEDGVFAGWVCRDCHPTAGEAEQ